MQRVLVYTAMLACLIDVFQRVGMVGLIDVVITVAYTQKRIHGTIGHFTYIWHTSMVNLGRNIPAIHGILWDI